LNKIDEAVKEFQIVLAYRPDDAEMHRNIAFLYYKQGKVNQAISACREAIRINPGDQKAGKLLKDLLEIKN
jgi:tetratricopeptide (TPR) repeat protein